MIVEELDHRIEEIVDSRVQGLFKPQGNRNFIVYPQTSFYTPPGAKSAGAMIWEDRY